MTVGGQLRYCAAANDLICGIETYNANYKTGINLHSKQFTADAAANTTNAGDGKLTGYEFANVNYGIRYFTANDHAIRQSLNGVNAGGKCNLEIAWVGIEIIPLPTDFKFCDGETKPSRQVHLRWRGCGQSNAEAEASMKFGGASIINHREAGGRTGDRE